MSTDPLREALEQALDRMETAWNAIGPDVWAESAKTEDGPAAIVAHALWFGQEEVRAALASETTDAGLLAEAIRRVEGLPYSARWTNSPDEYVSESAVLSILRDLASRDTGATTGGLPPADPRLAGTEYGPV